MNAFKKEVENASNARLIAMIRFAQKKEEFFDEVAIIKREMARRVSLDGACDKRYRGCSEWFTKYI